MSHLGHYHPPNLPSGKRFHNYGKAPFYSWVNQRFLWQFSIAMLNYQSASNLLWLYIYITNRMDIWIYYYYQFHIEFTMVILQEMGIPSPQFDQ